MLQQETEGGPWSTYSIFTPQIQLCPDWLFQSNWYSWYPRTFHQQVLSKSKQKSETELYLSHLCHIKECMSKINICSNVWNILEINDIITIYYAAAQLYNILHKTSPNCDHITRFLPNYILCEEEIYKAHLKSLEGGKDSITRVWSEVAHRYATFLLKYIDIYI